jgi:hypothetical protein
LVRAIDDRDVGVAANAAAALGRLGRRVGLRVDAPLCGRLDDARAYVRANALSALRWLGSTCDLSRLERQLERDASPLVREHAAELLWTSVASQPDVAFALERCAEQDPSGRVALACRAPRAVPARASFPVTLFVLPATASEPSPRAPFALVSSDQMIRLGLADRRGAVFEPAAPAGQLRLEVPTLVEP